MSGSDTSPRLEPVPSSDLRATLAVDHPEVEVWAAGGVILRDTGGTLEVLLIHRPDRDDWSFPKGKMDDGESLEAAAEREVEEETGFRCRRLAPLPIVRYVDSRDREKLVAYWTMAILDGCFEPNPEVDSLGWFDLRSAAAVLTYECDVGLLGAVGPEERHPRMPA